MCSCYRQRADGPLHPMQVIKIHETLIVPNFYFIMIFVPKFSPQKSGNLTVTYIWIQFKDYNPCRLTESMKNIHMIQNEKTSKYLCINPTDRQT